MADKHPDPNIYWFWRRTMALLALGFSFLQTVSLIVLASYGKAPIDVLSPVIGWSYGMCTFVIGSYFGNTAIKDYIDSKNNER